MSERVRRDGGLRSVPLGEIDPAGSRHVWTRSAVHLDGERAFTGEWDGTVTARDVRSLEARWTVDHPDRAVGIETLSGNGGTESTATVVVAGRGETGTIGAYDAATGDRRWRYDAVADVGEADRDSIFHLPYVVALETDGDRLYAAARRYERDGETRRWHGAVLAFDPDGSVRWRYAADASPIALDLADGGDRLAVGYNRCAGDHDTGLVVLEADSGDPAWTWDPGTEGDRRVGGVSFDGDALAVSSHGDKRGYLLGPGGVERWHVDLAVETAVGDETLYAYPNHVHARDGRVAFVTGNTYALESRETDHRHPNEHRIAAFDGDGDPLWADDVGGFVHELEADGGTVALPCAQNFRVRDPETHAVRWFDLADGSGDRQRVRGVATAVALEGETIAAVEEPVRYHDEGDARGRYALGVGSIR